MRGYPKNSLKVYLIIAITLLSISLTQNETIEADSYNFTLKAKCRDGTVGIDYLQLVAEQLRELKIKLEIEPTIPGDFVDNNYFDLVYVSTSEGGPIFDYSNIFSENGSENILGYQTNLDWDDELGTGKNEWFLKTGSEMIPPNSTERVNHYWEWEQYMMDKICPLLPTSISQSWSAYWSNLRGFSRTNGLHQSWGKMYWRDDNDLHIGQANRRDINIADAFWQDLNPLFQEDSASEFVSDLVLDPLVWYDSDYYVRPHLATSLNHINDTHVRINIREGITWQNDTNDVYVNYNLTAKDVYFTLYAWKYLSNRQEDYLWLKDIKITGNQSVDIFIDANPATNENEPYLGYLEKIAVNILPEHYLNVTQLPDGKTPDTTQANWAIFSRNCFGTGLFKLTGYTEGLVTIVYRDKNSWWLKESITNDNALNWLQRFGDFDSNLRKIIIHVIEQPELQIEFYERGLLDIVDVTNHPEKRNAFVYSSRHRTSRENESTVDYIGYNIRETSTYLGNRDPTPMNPGMTIGLAIRKAINYAIDREEINRIVHGNERLIINHPTRMDYNAWLNPNIIQYNHNLQTAKELMIDAGFTVTNYTPDLNGFSTIVTSLSIIGVAIITLFVRKRLKK